MTSSLSENLGREGYTVVARAPNLGLPQFANGSWHVLGGSNPTQPELMHEIDYELIPFILSSGGDIVVYRLSDNGVGLAKPVLSRGGMAGRPPNLMAVNSFDASLVRKMSALRESLAEPVAPPVPPKVPTRFDWRLPACVAAGLALLIGGTTYLVLPGPQPGRWVPDMTNPRDAAIARGATVMAVPSKSHPGTMLLYRIYPGGPGKGAIDQVGSFNQRDLATLRGDIPDSRLEWRKDF